MRPSPWSVGIIMIVVAGLGLSGLGRTAIAPAAWVIAGLLIAGGVALMTRRRVSFWVALAAAIVLVLSSVAGFLHHPELGLPMPPALALVVGVYLCLRIVIARPALGPQKKRSFLPDDEPEQPK